MGGRETATSTKATYQARQLLFMGIYVEAETCVETLARQENRKLVNEAVAFSRAKPEMVQVLGPRVGVLARQIVSPTVEAIAFVKKTEALGLSPLFATYRNDLFKPSLNAAKRRLGKLRVNVRQSQFRNIGVVDFKHFEHRPIRDVRTRGGLTLEDFHLRAWQAEFGEFPSTVLDFSDFYGTDRPGVYYERLFALFTCMGILFENYQMDGDERRFTEGVVLPAYEATVRRFGCPPVIVRIIPDGEEALDQWDTLPASTLPLALAEVRATRSSLSLT